VLSLSTWSTFPLLPATILLLGAFLVWLVRRFLPSPSQAATVVPGVLSGLSAVGAIVAIWMLRQPTSPLDFLAILPPALGANLTLQVQLDGWGRLFGLVLLWPMLAVAGLAVVDSLAGADPRSDSPSWLQWLLLLAAAFVVLSAADWLTLVAAFVLFDLVYLVAAAPRTGHGWGFMANGLGGLAILSAVFVLSLGNRNLALGGDEPLPVAAALLITLAILIRLAPYPLHFWLSDPSPDHPTTWHWSMRLCSPSLGLYLLTRFAPLLVEMSGSQAVLIAGVGGCLVAALLAWLTAQQSSQRAVPLVALYQVCFALVGWAGLGQEFGSLWVNLNLVLGTVALVVHREWLQASDEKLLAWRDALPGAVAVAALAGLPLTAGLFVRLPLYRALLVGKLAGELALILVAESIVAATLLRVWCDLGKGVFLQRPQVKQRPWGDWAAMSLLVAPMLIAGVYPPLGAWLAGFPPTSESPLFLPIWTQLAGGDIGLWAALLLPLVMGYGIYRSEWVWPVEMVDVRARLISYLGLDWLHRAVDRLLSRVGRALWAVGAVLHGEGYLAWVALSLLLLFLFVLNRR